MACPALKADGTPCGANSRGDGPCFVHQPDANEKLREARSLGGKNRHTGDTGVVHASLDSAESVRSIVRNTVRKLRHRARGKDGQLAEYRMEPDRANAIFKGCMVALKVLEVEKLDKRVDELERRTAGLDGFTDEQKVAFLEWWRRHGASESASGH